jgi:CheY-like chemotaxis protein
MIQWRVLFVINSETDLGTIKSYLNESSENEIKSAIEALTAMGLLDGSAAPPVAAEVIPEAPTKAEPAIEKAPVEEDVSMEEEIIADVAIESDEDNVELEDIVAEIGEEDELEAIDFSNSSEPEPEPEAAEKTEAEPEKIVQAKPEATEVSGDKKTLIVADESIVIRKMVELALENEAFNVIGYSSAQEILDNFDKDGPAIIIVDLNLPDTKGTEIVQKIKAKKDVPCLVFAAKNAGIDEEKLKGEGVADFVAKPFRDEDLIAKVNELA